LKKTNHITNLREWPTYYLVLYVDIARQKMLEAVANYAELSTNMVQLSRNVEVIVGGAIRSFLGPAAELGPVKEIADRLFA